MLTLTERKNPNKVQRKTLEPLVRWDSHPPETKIPHILYVWGKREKKENGLHKHSHNHVGAFLFPNAHGRFRAKPSLVVCWSSLYSDNGKYCLGTPTSITYLNPSALLHAGLRNTQHNLPARLTSLLIRKRLAHLFKWKHFRDVHRKHTLVHKRGYLGETLSGHLSLLCHHTY